MKHTLFLNLHVYIIELNVSIHGEKNNTECKTLFFPTNTYNPKCLKFCNLTRKSGQMINLSNIECFIFLAECKTNEDISRTIYGREIKNTYIDN